MKSYPHVITKLFYEPLIVTHAQHAAMVQVLEARLAGGDNVGLFSREQLSRTIRTKADRKRVHDDNPDLYDEEDEAQAPQPDWQTYGKDAIIPVHGVLVGHASDIPMSSCGCGCDTVAGMIEVALADAEVEKLIFDFRSPGGSVTGIPELGRRIAAITSKKTVAFTDDQCCSGALWLATQCQHFYATPSATVGSIGVWCAYLDISRQLANEGVNIQEISAGKYKTMGAYWRTLTPEEKASIQKDVDKIYVAFKAAVNLRREVTEEFMQGQQFDGEEAMEHGLCDGLVDGIDELLSEEVAE